MTTRPRTALLAAVGVAAIAGALAAWKLDFRTDRSELVSMDQPWNRRYAEYKRNYPRWDDITIAIEGPRDDRAIDDLARSVAEVLRSDERIASVEAGFDASEAPRMYQLATGDEFQVGLSRVGLGQNVAASTNVNSALMALLLATPDSEADQGALRTMLEPFVAAVRGDEAEFRLGESTTDRWQPFVSTSGRIRIISVQIDDDVVAVGGLVEMLRSLSAEVGTIVALSAPEVKWGITGIGAIEAEETSQSTRDSAVASALAVVLLGGLLVMTFRGVVVPLFALASLMIALCWAFGWAAIAVGHLQILSIFFTVMFLGLGMDFAVHIAARLELVRDEEERLPEAAARVFAAVGPSIITGAVTTAASFATIALTDFRGAAELGLICAGGILLCVICVPTVFPAMLAMSGRWRTIIHSRPPHALNRARAMVEVFTRRPRLTVAMSFAMFMAMGWLGSTVRYDPNILNLQPPGTESVLWERRLVEEDQTTAWAALLPVRPDLAAEVVRDLREVEEVEIVSAMGMVIEPDVRAWQSKMQAVEAVRDAPLAAPSIPDGAVQLREQLVLISAGIRQVEPDLASVAEWIDDAIEDASRVPGEQLEQVWLELNESFLETRVEVALYTEIALRTDSPSPENIHEFLPAALRARWIGAGGSWLLRIQPRVANEPVLHPDRLGPFVQAVRRVAPNVIGPPVQIYESGRLIQRSYITAALLAIPLVVLVLLLDFRSLADAACVLLPMLFGFVSMFGLMAVCSVPLNFANMMVLPITFGIAIDAGVHMVHRWRSDPQGQPPGLSGGTGRGITVSVLTTLIGFACLLVAEHRGIRSLGFVVVAGQSTMLLACYTLLPAVLTLRTKRQMLTDEGESQIGHSRSGGNPE